MNQCDFLYIVKILCKYVEIPVNHDHVITQNVNIDLLILKCTCHLKTLSYCLQMAELSVNTGILYNSYMITGYMV